MTIYLIVQGVNCAILVAFSVVLLRLYHVQISRPAQLSEYQYRLFALRDRAISLVVNGDVQEDDERWRVLYEHLNDSAKFTSVRKMKNGFSFVLSLLRHASPPTASDIAAFHSLPETLQQLWRDYVDTVLAVCWEGSARLRLFVKAARRYAIIKRWIDRKRPREAKSYWGFTQSAQMLATA